MNSLMLIVWVLAIAGISWGQTWRGLSLALLVLPTYIIRFQVMGIPTNLFEITILTVVGVYLVRGGDKAIRQLLAAYRMIALPLAVLAVGLIVGVAVSNDITTSLGIVKGWFVVPLLVYGLAVSITKKEHIERIVWPLLISTLPIALVAVAQTLWQVGITPDGRAPAWFASPNYLALYTVPILALATGLTSHNNKAVRAFLYILLGIGGLAVIATFSYGGWMALGLSAIVIAVHSWPRQSLWVGLGAIVATAIATVSQLGNARFVGMLDLANRSSASVRMQVWATDILMVKENLLTGIGLGQYPDRYLSFASRLFSPPIETGMLHGHNLYLQFAIETGLAGLIFLGLIVAYFWRFLANTSPQWRPALLAGLVAILGHGLVDTTYWKNDLAVIFWVVIALSAVGYNQKDG